MNPPFSLFFRHIGLLPVYTAFSEFLYWGVLYQLNGMTALTCIKFSGKFGEGGGKNNVTEYS
jgi:hypothetical protein